MKRLQVFINSKWEYVFCRNELKRDPIITKDKIKGIKGDNSSLEYFQRYFAGYDFRIV
jgi:hypothetical protein